MNNQEIFDKVLSHLRAQGKAAVDTAGDCVYRGVSGTMCAVGCLIPESLYDYSIEGLGVVPHEDRAWNNSKYDPIDTVLSAIGISECQYEFLSRLQHAHDSRLNSVLTKDPITYWEDAMSKIALDYNLTYKGRYESQ